MISALGVVIPVHGAIEPVLPLLDALLGEGVPDADRPAQVVVVDDASPHPVDAARLPEGVEFVRREVNGGFGAAVNTGIDHLTTPLALVLNSDLEIPPGFARTLVEHAAPWQPAVVGCRNADHSGRSGYAARVFPTTAHQVVEWLVPLAGLRHLDLLHRAVGHDMRAERGHGMVPVDWVSGAVMLLPVAQVRAIGGFDEGYFMYTEEVDLQKRLRGQGIPSLYDTDLTVLHVGGASSGGELRRRRWLVGARMRYARKHRSVVALRLGLTAASAVNLVWQTGRRLAGRDVDPLGAAREELSLIWTAGRDLPR
ncbi:glycosyltransferase family 2 protein [Brachybacterium sp. EF45031]|uniref:glycosyltransferase family 2 protein n=1 Tax=Brachybacterium sillae TaxID=2810536 RepID=UPI00217E5A48|nr:glycosyltransferase family 2 protein [Brachybacterium sillae]MCS6711641.1 glycosyltransferase family 2 protein [Brachybacterium sillae]